MSINKKWLNLSDVHTHHPNNSTDYVLTSLRTFLGFQPKAEHNRFHDLDFILLTGDFFDSRMDASDADLFSVIQFIHDFFAFCERYRIGVLNLEGTPSHDWRQSRLFQELYNSGHYSFFFRYVDTIHAEFYPELGFSFLFVPDPGLTPRIEVERSVLAALEKANLQQVDIALLHGVAEYQVKDIPTKAPTFDENFYLRLVKISIHCGHVHIHSLFDRFFVPGSFERLVHGEEDPKGGMLFCLRNDHLTYNFIENKRARIFKTIRVKEETLEEVIEFLDKRINKYPAESFIRLSAKKGHLVFGALKTLKVRYWQYHLSLIDEEQKEKHKQRTLEDDFMTYTLPDSVTLNAENIVSVVMKQLYEKQIVSSYDGVKLSNYLSELL